MRRLTIYLVTLLLIGFHHTSFGQMAAKRDTAQFEDRGVKSEMGFDMYYFLNIFRQHYEGMAATVFTVEYNRDLNDKITLRTSVGAGFNSNQIKEDTLTPLNSKTIEGILRGGIAWEKDSYKRWQYYYGVDFSFQYGYNSNEQSTTVKNTTYISNNIQNSYRFGPGPFLGLVFFLNPRVSLSLESYMNFMYNYDQTKIVDESGENKTSVITNKGFVTSFTTPQNIFLNIKF